MTIHDSFLNESELSSLGFIEVGSNVKISRFARFYGANFLVIGENVRIDDFSIISLGRHSQIGNNVHISCQTTIHASHGIEIGNFSTISGRVGIYGQSDDYSGEWLANPTIPSNLRGVKASLVSIGVHTLIGSNSTVLPGANIADGVAIGAHSLVTQPTDPWGIYVGVPARRIKERNKRVLKLEEQINNSYPSRMK
jgi:dTDP-4-amino-4,6-dideoxy-D-glucose acyltransferase